jgi:hypothetical protein
MRWLERYLVESSARLQHFTEITASLAGLEKWGGLASDLRIEERVPERGTRRAPVPTKTWVPDPPSSTPLSGRSQRPLFLLVRRLRIEERELQAGAYRWRSYAHPLMAPGAFRGYGG